VEGPKVEASEAKALTEDEIVRLLDATAATSWHAFFVHAIATGARRGELCALRWGDVDLDGETATIRGSLSQSRFGIDLKGTKTERVRIVPLTPDAIDAVRKHRARQAAERLAVCEAYVDHGFVFANPLGSPIPPQRFTQAFDHYARKLELSTRKLHRTTAAVLGHSATSTTANVYAHVLPGAQARAVAAIGARITAARSRVSTTEGKRMATADVTKAGASAGARET
jgi:integrase